MTTPSDGTPPPPDGESRRPSGQRPDPSADPTPAGPPPAEGTTSGPGPSAPPPGGGEPPAESTWLFGPDFGREEPRVRGSAKVSAPPPRQEIAPEELSGLTEGYRVAPNRDLRLEDEPSALVGRYLFPTERYRGEWKRHPIHLARHLLIAAGATVALGVVSGMLAGSSSGDGATALLFLAWLGVMIWVGWEVADWFCDRFILTNKRVMVVSGIITRKVAMMPLARVTDMKFEQSPLGRVLNYGTFVLESAGQDQALREVAHLPNPNELYLRVVEEMYEPAAVEARMSMDDEDDA